MSCSWLCIICHTLIVCSVLPPSGQLIKLPRALGMGVQPETVLQNKIRLAVSAQCPDTVLFRNHTGALRDPKTGQMVRFGLAPGSPDLVGWKSVVVTEDMVGQRIAVFCGIEIKMPGGKLREDQRHFLDRLSGAGGVAAVARSVPDAVAILHTSDVLG
jgi:hypothetical protein